MNDTSTLSSSAHIASPQEKLDAIFGITGGKSVDEFLNELTIDATHVQQTMDAIEQNVKEQAQNINMCQNNIQSGASIDVLLDISSIGKSLKEVEDMIQLSKDVLKHVADSILCTSLVDSESVQAYSKLLESIHLNIVEFITIYKDKSNFIDKIKFALFQQQQKKEMMLFKHKLDLEKIKLKNGPDEVQADSISTRQWNQEQITKFLNEVDADELNENVEEEKN